MQCKLLGLFLYSFTAVKRDAIKVLTACMKRVPFVNRRYSKGVPFLLKMVSFMKGLEVEPHGGAFLHQPVLRY